MQIRQLSINQTHDPARGSFLVKPRPIEGKRVTVIRRGEKKRLRVFTSCHMHPEAYEFVAVDESVS